MLDKKTLRSIFLGAAGCIVLYWLLHSTERVRAVYNMMLELLHPFTVGAALAFILNVPMRAVERQIRRGYDGKGTRIIALILTIVLVALVFAFIFYLLIPQLENTAQTIAVQLPPFIKKVDSCVRDFLMEHPELGEWLMENTDVESMNWNALFQQAVDIVGTGIHKVLGGAVTAVGGVINGLIGIFVSMIFGLYCLSNKEHLARQGRLLLYAYLPEHWADETIRILRIANSTFSNFISGQCIEVLILGSMFAVSMYLFQMPYVPLVSVLVAVTAFIPIVGAWIGCVLGAFFILVNDPMQAVWFVILFLILQQIENNLIYPRVVGTSIGLPSMWVLFAVTVGGTLMGVAGMILMIPLFSVVYTVLREYAVRRVGVRKIDPDKLRDHPPELRSKFKEKREVARKKREAKRAAELAEMMKQKLHFPDNDRNSGDNKQ